MYKLNEVEVEWLGHATVKIKGAGKIIYIDPYEIKEGEEADLILVTHTHYDHLSEKDIEKLRGEVTEIVVTRDGEEKLKGKITSVLPGEKKELQRIKIEAIPAYNLNKPFHPRVNQWVGYVVEVEGKRIYHAGDTDFIPEMKSLSNIDLALLPVGGTYTMDAKEAADAVESFKPRVVCPIHWGTIVGSRENALEFKEKVKSSQVVLL